MKYLVILLCSVSRADLYQDRQVDLSNKAVTNSISNSSI